VNRGLRTGMVALLVVIAPLAVYHHVGIFTTLLNLSIPPIGYIRHADVSYS
jgi:hypothetical protein